MMASVGQVPGPLLFDAGQYAIGRTFFGRSVRI